MMKKFILMMLIVMTCGGAYHFTSVAGSTGAAEPVYVVTHVDVMPNFTAAGREALQQFATETRKDVGAVRIEVLEELNRPNHSTMVEVWESRKAYDDHLALDHTRAFRTKLQPMMGSPFDERLHRMNQR